MKKFSILLIFMLLYGSIFSQDIILTFSGEIQATGTPIDLDKVVIENLTRGGSIELTDNFTINLSNLVSIHSINTTDGNGFQKVYPNPFNSALNIEFYSEGKGYSSILVYNIKGQIVASIHQKFEKGVNQCVFTPKNAGVYFISLNDNGKVYTSKAISTKTTNAVAELTYQGLISSKKSKNYEKSDKGSFYEIGDILRYTATAGNYVMTIYDSPGESKSYTFEFAERFFKFEKYHIESNIPCFVDIMFSVSDAQNKGVDYLTNDDFVVLEDDNTISPSETFRYVKKLAEVPYSQKTVIMIDNSASLADDLEQIKSAAINLVNQIAENQEIAIYSFSDNINLLQDFTSNVADLENAINSITVGYPSTNLYGAIITGLGRWENSYSLDGITEGYLIALTDGDDTQGSYTLQQVIDARGTKKVYMVGLGDEINPDNLNQISYPGNYISVLNIDDLEQAFIDIQYDIARFANSFYWLNYMTPKRNGIHTLKVGATDNTNTAADAFLEGSFNADGFESVYSGVYANIDADSLYGISNINLEYLNYPPSFSLKATTYWANEPPIYSWSVDNNTITVQVNSNDNSKAVITANTPADTAAILTLSDIANNYTKNINISVVKMKPTVITTDITNISYYSATVGGEVVSEGQAPVTSRGICWSTHESPTTADSCIVNGSGIGTFSCDISNLENVTTYYVRAYATNNYGTSYGEQKTFTTSPLTVPTVITGDISNISYTSATCSGNVTDGGGIDVTSYGICYSTSPNPTISDAHTTNGSGLGSFSADISDLTVNTTYYVRAYAINSIGIGYGEQKIFSTLDYTLPVVTTGDVSNISYTTAICGGNVTDDGGSPSTVYGICYSTSPNPTVSDAHTICGTGIGTFSDTLIALNFNTTYYVRAYAENPAGTSYGEQKSFTTQDYYTTLTDFDGNTYGAVLIGSQVWMAENLKVTHYPDGTEIPHITNDTVWMDLPDNNTDGAYCYYNNNENNEADIYGALYTYAAAIAEDWTHDLNSGQGICPDGWHLPTQAEWQELIDYLGGSDIAGGKLKEAGTTHWNSSNEGATNESGFTALPSGTRNGYHTGLYNDLGNNCYLWSATESSINIKAYQLELSNNNQTAALTDYWKSHGLSVRCIKD